MDKRTDNMEKDIKIEVVKGAIKLIQSGKHNFICNAIEFTYNKSVNEFISRGRYWMHENFGDLLPIADNIMESQPSKLVFLHERKCEFFGMPWFFGGKDGQEIRVKILKTYLKHLENGN